MYQLAVIGNPIEHSLSPLIWQTFAKDLNIQLVYNKIHAEIDDFESVVNSFFVSGGTSLSVTAPFKARAFALSNQHNHNAVACQTANLLINKNGMIIADNTDGVGLLDDLRYKGIDIGNKNILMIGNGSVIHSVLNSLVDARPARIDLLMRNWDNLGQFQDRADIINAYDSDIAYDVIINTTPNTPQNDLFQQIRKISQTSIAYDMIYTAKQTLFLRTMEQLYPNVIQANGIGMLIHQAKVAFDTVFGVTPEVEHLYLILQEQFR